MRILVVEDNEKLGESLKDILEHLRYEADVSLNGEEGYEMVMSGLYDGIILDIMLPGMDGMTILKKARAGGIKTPVMVLTARSETEDKVEGLMSGADYYLTKPFDKEELAAALTAILRRGGDMIPHVLEFGDIRLGKREYEVLQILMHHKGAVVSKETLILKIWGNDGEAVDNNVEIYISFLRKKLNFLRAETEIVTARHLGYYLEERGRQ